MDSLRYKNIIDHLQHVNEFKEILKSEINDDSGKKAFHLTSGDIKIILTQKKDGRIFEVPLLIKVAGSTDADRIRHCIGEKFRKESNFYSMLLPKMIETLGQPDLQDLFPRCYYTALDVPHEMIVLEDLSIKGFEPNGDPFHVDLDIFKMAFTSIAKFHAAGIAYKWKKPGQIQEILRKLFLKEYIFSEHLKKIIDKTYRRGLEAAEKGGKSFSEIFKKNFKNIMMTYDKDIHDDGPWMTICHGDYVINNIMITKNEIKIIDMQMVCYFSVGFDLTNLIYISTDREFRKKHLTALLHLYHEEFLRNLMEFTNFTKEMLEQRGFSFDSLVQEFQKCIPYTYRICSFFLGLLIDPFLVRNLSNWDFSKTCSKIIIAGGAVIDQKLADIVNEIAESKILDNLPNDF